MAKDPVNPQDISPVRLVDETGEQLDGQQLMAASVPVALASDQTDVPVSLDGEQVDVSDRAARDLGRVDIADELPAGTQNIGDVDIAGINAIGPVAGQDTMTNSLPVVLASDQSVIPVDATGQGDVPITLDSEQVDVSDRAARVLGKVDVAGIDAVGASAGQALMASSFPVTVASDQSNMPVRFGDSPSLDAFQRLRVSNPTTLYDAQLQYDDQPLLWETDINGAGSTAHLPNQSALQLTVTDADGDRVTRQTRAYYRYQPGKSQLIVLSGLLGVGKAGVSQRIGLLYDQNGLFFEYIGTTLNVTLRSFVTGATVNTRVAQTGWNLDVMDGSGVSGVTLDVTKAQIFVVDLEWLSSGRVRMGFFMNGAIVYVHEFLNANVLATPYMTTANLPLRYEIENTAATSGSTTLLQVCAMIASEGGFSIELGFPFMASNGTTTISVTTRRPILSIRPRALFNSIANRVSLLPEHFNVYSQDQDIFYEIVYGGTLTDASFANVDATYSAMEKDVAATAISGGVVLDSGFVVVGAGPGSNTASGAQLESLLSKLPLTLDKAGAHPTSPLTDSLSIVTTSIPSGATDVSASLSWRELR